MTPTDALKLKVGDVVHTTYPGWPACNSSHSNRWKVSGKAKTWKSKGREHEFRIPIKHGMYSYDYIDHDNIQWFHREGECENG